MLHIYKDGSDSYFKLIEVVKLLSKDDILLFVGDGVINCVRNKNELHDLNIYALDIDCKARGITEIKIGEMISLEKFVCLVAENHSPISW